MRIPVVEPCADGFVVMTFVLGAQGNAAFAAAMRWLEDEGVLDEDLCGRDWEPWIDEMKAGGKVGKRTELGEGDGPK